jgi:hypothetical protein
LAKDYRVISKGAGTVLFKADLWATLEIWRHGEQIVQ